MLKDIHIPTTISCVNSVLFMVIYETTVLLCYSNDLYSISKYNQQMGQSMQEWPKAFLRFLRALVCLSLPFLLARQENSYLSATLIMLDPENGKKKKRPEKNRGKGVGRGAAHVQCICTLLCV